MNLCIVSLATQRQDVVPDAITYMFPISACEKGKAVVWIEDQPIFTVEQAQSCLHAQFDAFLGSCDDMFDEFESRSSQFALSLK